MSNLGDLVYNLIGNATSFVGANDKARASNDVLSGSVNSIIGQLNRQKKAFEDVGKSTLDYIATDKKASEETKELARSLLLQVDALKKLASAANDPILKMMHATHAANDPFQVGMRKMGNQRVSDAASAERDANDPFLRGLQNQEDPFSRGLRVMGVQNAAQNAATKAAAQRDANDPFLNGMARWQKENDVFARGLAQLRSNNAAEIAERERRNAERRRLDAVAENDPLLRMMNNTAAANDPFQVGLRRMAANNAANTPRPVHQNQAPRDNRQWAGVEGMRAIEDFFQGSAFGGIRGGILAASNNIGQMGAAFGAMGAMAGSAVSTIIILGSTAYEAWRKSTSGGEAAERSVRKYNEALSETIPHLMRLHDLRVGRQDLPSESAEGSAVAHKAEERAIARAKEEMALKSQAEDTVMKGSGALGLNAADLQKEADRRNDTIGAFFKWMGRSHSMVPLTQAEQLSNESVSKDAIERRRKAEADIQHGAFEITQREAANLDRRGELIRLQANTDAEAEAEIERGFRRSQQIFPDLTDEERKNKHRDFANAENAKVKDKFERGQAWVKSRSEELMLSGMKNEKERDYYATQKEFHASLGNIQQAKQMGIIGWEQAGEMSMDAQRKRDRDMRKTKFGDMQADGQSGFGSADIKSSAGMNAVMKAMRYTEQSQTIAELKKNGDITKEVVTAVNNVKTILEKAPIPVWDF